MLQVNNNAFYKILLKYLVFKIFAHKGAFNAKQIIRARAGPKQRRKG
jgi:hypothetical protein